MKKKINKLLASLDKNRKKIFTKKRMIFGLVVALFLAGVYFSRSLVFAAWVNGRPVYRFTLVNELEKQGGKQVLDGLIEKSLVDSEAKKSKITISQTEIDSEIKNIETTISGQGISLDEALNLRGMTRKNLEDQIKTQKTIEKILASKIVITDQELRDYFNTNKTLFGQNPVFDKVKDQVNTQLFQQKLSEEYTTWITDLKTKAKILYFVNL